MKKTRLFPLVAVAAMTALATVIYMLFPEIPLVPGVEYLKVDLSDIPAVVTGMTVGPVYGILVELLKNVIHLTRTTTFGIGELMNTGIGAVMLLTLWCARRLGARLLKKETESAAAYYVAAVAALLATVLAGWLLNAALTPLFYRLMNWPMTTATLMAGVWGSTLLNTVKCVVSVLPVYHLVRITRKTVKKYI